LTGKRLFRYRAASKSNFVDTGDHYLDSKELFVKVEGSGEVPSPANDEHLMLNNKFATF
jgi:hypothetical protein